MMYPTMAKGARIALSSVLSTTRNLKLVVFPLIAYGVLVAIEMLVGLVTKQFIFDDVYCPCFRSILRRHLGAFTGDARYVVLVLIALALALLIAWTIATLVWAMYKILDRQSFSLQSALFFGLESLYSPTLIVLSFVPAILSLYTVGCVTVSFSLSVVLDALCMFVCLFFMFAIVVHIAENASFTASLTRSCSIIPRVIYELTGGMIVLGIMLSGVYYLIENVHRVIAWFSLLKVYTILNYRLGVIASCYVPLLAIVLVYMAIIFFFVHICHAMRADAALREGRLARIVRGVMRFFGRR